MARRTFVFDPPDRFVAGTIGEPGGRTFFLQAREGRRIVSVVLEKVQVAALADRLGILLFELSQRGVVEPASGPAAQDAAPLDEPLEEAFRAGTLTLGWDGASDRILIEAHEIEDGDADAIDLEAIDDEPEGGANDDLDGPAIFRVRLTMADARSFAERAVRVVHAGRPACPLCGNPLDPQGHICPRRNGQYVN